MLLLHGISAMIIGSGQRYVNAMALFNETVGMLYNMPDSMQDEISEAFQEARPMAGGYWDRYARIEIGLWLEFKELAEARFGNVNTGYEAGAIYVRVAAVHSIEDLLGLTWRDVIKVFYEEEPDPDEPMNLDEMKTLMMLGFGVVAGAVMGIAALSKFNPGV
jgi:hypothetical protein